MWKPFSKEMSRSIKNTYKTKNTCVIYLIIVFEHKKTIMFKVLGTIMYSLYDRYVCFDYLCLHHYKLYNTYACLKNTTFDNLSGIGITDVLIVIMPCHRFSRLQWSNIISSYCYKFFLIYCKNNLWLWKKINKEEDSG